VAWLHSPATQLLSTTETSHHRLNKFLFSNVKQKRYPTFKITYMNIQCRLITTLGLKSIHKGTKGFDCNNTCINRRDVHLFFNPLPNFTLAGRHTLVFIIYGFFTSIRA
jgi:hypothetical protein